MGGLLGAVLVARHAAALALALALAWPAAERWLAPFGPAPAREELALEVRGRLLQVDLYRPPEPHGALILIHGLSAAGRHQPDLARLARLLAERGQLVLVPHLEGLVRFQLGGTEVEDIRAVADHARRRWGSVGLAGFSFGAGPVLLAAAELPELRVVGAFGGYADLRHVVSFVTTGVHRWNGQRYVERPEPGNRWKLLALLAGFVGRERDGAQLAAIAAARLVNRDDDTRALETDLGVEGRAVLALVMNEREEAVEGLLAALPEAARQTLDRLSPLPIVGRLRARLLIAHGVRDASIPYTESLRLAAGAGGRPRLAIFETFHHAGPQAAGLGLAALGDGWSLLRLLDDLLSRRSGPGVL